MKLVKRNVNVDVMVDFMLAVMTGRKDQRLAAKRLGAP
jgi:hypothetical protein